MSIQKINRKSKPFLVRCRGSAGKVISATFATRSEAQEFELSHKAEKQMPTVLQIDAVERADVARIKKLCAENGVALNEAIAMFQRAIGEPIKKWKAIYPPVMKMQRSVGCRTTTDNVYQQWLKAKRALPCKVPQDALRHSFASYAYHVFGVEKAVEILGHDYNVYKKFYKSIATEADSIAYFNILPAAGRTDGNKK